MFYNYSHTFTVFIMALLVKILCTRHVLLNIAPKDMEKPIPMHHVFA